MAHYISNAGDASELRERVTNSQNSKNDTVFVLLDKERTLHINNTSKKDDELIVICTDVGDYSTVVLHLPYAANSAASAYIIHPKGDH